MTLNEYLKIILPALGGFISGAGLIWWKWKLDNSTKPKTTMDKTTQKSLETDRFCWTLKDKFNARRVAVFLLHNGGSYFTGDHIKRMTCVNETPAGRYLSDFDQVLIRGPLMRWVNELRTNDTYYVPDVDQHQDAEIQALMVHYGSKASWSIMLRDRDSDPVGILSISFDQTAPLNLSAIAGLQLQVKKLEKILLG